MEQARREVRFSIVTPAFDADRFLGRAIDSVRAQSRDDWEMIVVDDGSADSTLRIARDAAADEPRIRVLAQDNAGAAAARNHAVRHATGEWLVFLDADDALELGYLARVAETAAAISDVGVVGTNGVTRYPDGSCWPTFPDPPGASRVEITLADQITSSRLTVTSAVRREVFLALEGFRDCYAEDYDLWLRVLAAGHRVVRVSESLVSYDATRADAKSRTREPELESVIGSLESLAREAALDSATAVLLERTLTRLRAEVELVPVKARIRARDYRGARAAFLRHRAAMEGMRRIVVVTLVLISPRLYRALAVRIDPSARESG